METECGGLVAPFLTLRERRGLRTVCRRWLFTCAWLQSSDDDARPRSWRKSVWNLQSRAFRHCWQTFLREECSAFLPRVMALLPAASPIETQELKRGLCLSTNTGQRPSFENPYARSGYIQSKINRCGNLPGLLFTDELSELRSELFRARARAQAKSTRWRIALYGGGPGFDSVGLVFLRKFLRVSDVAFHTTVYDNEPGWQRAVEAVGRTLDGSESSRDAWSFETCDITLDVSTAENMHVCDTLEYTQLHVFAFVCVENFCLLRESAYVFLRSLFAGARVDSVFVFTDSTHRLWPAIFDVAQAVAPERFRVWTPFARGCHYALVLQKLPPHAKPASEHAFYTQAMAKLREFRRHQQQQLRAMAKQQAAETDQ